MLTTTCSVETSLLAQESLVVDCMQKIMLASVRTPNSYQCAIPFLLISIHFYLLFTIHSAIRFRSLHPSLSDIVTLLPSTGVTYA